MSYFLVLMLFMLAMQGQGSEDSCADNCGQSAGECWCDKYCTALGDCCDDYSDQCEGCEPDCEPDEDACYNKNYNTISICDVPELLPYACTDWEEMAEVLQDACCICGGGTNVPPKQWYWDLLNQQNSNRRELAKIAERRELAEVEDYYNNDGSCKSSYVVLPGKTYTKFCGDKSEGQCYCDDACYTFGDCCTDVAAVCNYHPPAGCDGLCGAKNFDEDCWCDDFCSAFGDCCDNYEKMCDNRRRELQEDSSECTDHIWEDQHGTDCEWFTTTKAESAEFDPCTAFGHLSLGTDGLDATQACCACGGGIETGIAEEDTRRQLWDEYHYYDNEDNNDAEPCIHLRTGAIIKCDPYDTANRRQLWDDYDNDNEDNKDAEPCIHLRTGAIIKCDPYDTPNN